MREILGVKLYGVEEVAELLGITERTVREYLKRGKMRGQKLAGVWEISEDNLRYFLNGNAEKHNKTETN